MTIKIYYGYPQEIWGQAPVSILKKHFPGVDKKNSAKDFRACPSVKSFYHNVYGIPAQRDYHLNITDKQTTSRVLTQQYFDAFVFTTDQERRSIQYGSIYFFTEEKTLPVTASYPPMLEKTLPHANYITGQMDLGRYPRPMTASLEFLYDTDWNIKKDDLLWYVKFHTKEKIQFIPFNCTQEIMDLYRFTPSLKSRSPIIAKTLIPFYNNVKESGIKKIMLKQIKQNLSGDYA
jgi:hypothetical protein